MTAMTGLSTANEQTCEGLLASGGTARTPTQEGFQDKELEAHVHMGVGSETLSASRHELPAAFATREDDGIPGQAWNSKKQYVAPDSLLILPLHEERNFQLSSQLAENTSEIAVAHPTPQRLIDSMTDATESAPAKKEKLPRLDRLPHDPAAAKPDTGGGVERTEAASGFESANRNAYEANQHLARDGFPGLRSPLTHPNGVPIFPDLSAEQEVTESSEATTQAESSIVADSDDMASIFDGAESDGGYGSDSATNASTSVTSSVRDYMYENGRRYHRFREGLYNFPNDEVEQEREDMKHAMVKLLCNQKLHFAPIGEWPQQILDIGTGTGAWAIEMGDQFESATVLGVDLSPIQPDWVPPNVKFEVDDVESSWLYPRNHFDYIHSRHTVMAIKNWRSLFHKAYEHLKPGGWIELQEIHHFPSSAYNAMPPSHPVAQYWSFVTQGLTSLGIDFNAAAGDRLPNMMREAGFVNVTEKIFHVPLGTWPRNRVLKTVGMYWRTILLDGLQAIALGPLTRGLLWTPEQIEMFLVSVRRAYHDNAALMYMPLRIMYAQKPAYGDFPR
ncbi:methyltransferase [Colletotrichum orchidophilum]|uniref:Methyltransferase n=1 Tax=Colletotrichum orchidophilum TaxID=1209926 RepID=A0A1G4B696_9PEZI|nr:methyltransferase [Colletotrichum orchidophilum]OHE96805.1 methyltransferase [Colletotrichum orchidophilum]